MINNIVKIIDKIKSFSKNDEMATSASTIGTDNVPLIGILTELYFTILTPYYFYHQNCLPPRWS